MKLQGILGGGTGKLGESIFSNNAGRTIVRQYNPHVRNPRTTRQQNSRDRFKVASELAKKLAPALAIGMPRIGALTSRNRFTSKVIPINAGVINYTNDVLSVDYSKVQVSKGGMPDIVISSIRKTTQGTGAVVVLDKIYRPENEGYVPPMQGTVGIVLVLVTADGKIVQVGQTIAVSSLEVGFYDVDYTLFAGGHAYVFAKWVPTAYNDIITYTLPWKFPSDQSETSYIAVPTE